MMKAKQVFVIVREYGSCPCYFTGDFEGADAMPIYTPVPTLAKHYEKLPDAVFEKHVFGIRQANIIKHTLFGLA